MTLSFESNGDVIIYALEKIISFARDNYYIFLAQNVWWISSHIGLQQRLVIHIDNLKERSDITSREAVSVTPRDIQDDSRTNTQSASATPRDLTNNK